MLTQRRLGRKGWRKNCALELSAQTAWPHRRTRGRG